jgi:hypothetical protein
MTNSLYPENKAEESSGFSAAYEGVKSKRKKIRRRKITKIRTWKREREGGRTGRASARAADVK